MPNAAVVTGTTSATTAATWIIWNTVWTTAASTNPTLTFTTTATDATWIAWNADYVYTEEGQAWHAQQQRRAQEEMAADAALRAEAQRRADELLREYLDAQQRDTYDKHRWFDVVSPRGNVYRVKRGRQGNVYRMERGREAVRYCIHPVDAVPDEDTMLAQALMIRTCEEEFERTANKTRLAA